MRLIFASELQVATCIDEKNYYIVVVFFYLQVCRFLDIRHRDSWHWCGDRPPGLPGCCLHLHISRSLPLADNPHQGSLTRLSQVQSSPALCWVLPHYWHLSVRDRPDPGKYQTSSTFLVSIFLFQGIISNISGSNSEAPLCVPTGQTVTFHRKISSLMFWLLELTLPALWFHPYHQSHGTPIL